jgi:hypothetical protein
MEKQLKRLFGHILQGFCHSKKSRRFESFRQTLADQSKPSLAQHLWFHHKSFASALLPSASRNQTKVDNVSVR